MLADIQMLVEENRNKDIKKVGINNLLYPINIIQTPEYKFSNYAKISIYLSLEKNKGTHMSRFLEAINEANEYTSLISEFPDKVIEQLKNKFPDTKSFYLKMRLKYFLKKIAPVTKKESWLDYDIEIDRTAIKADNWKNKTILTVGVYYTSLCPCSKEISDYGAHNQRSKAMVSVELKKNTYIKCINTIINSVESVASCDIYPLLKREDEKYVTEHAYDNPKFVEDIVRDISINLDKFLLDKSINDYSIVVEHFESIHNHNAVAVITAGRNLI